MSDEVTCPHCEYHVFYCVCRPAMQRATRLYWVSMVTFSLTILALLALNMPR